MVTSLVPLDKLFTDFKGKSTGEVFATQKCLSRLIEMQTRAYLQTPHKEDLD